MNIIDILIIVLLISFAIIGFKRGFLNSLVMFVGAILVIILSYAFKNILGDFLVLNLPFIRFGNFLGGAVTLNIILYQIIAFVIMSIIFTLIYKFILSLTGIIEKLLKYTIVLGIPSKILGMVVGFLEGYVIIYIFLFVLSQPFVNINILENSQYASTIVEKTPLLSSYVEDSLKIWKEIEDVSKLDNSNQINLEITRLILKNKVTGYDTIQKLVDMKKIEVDGIEEIINEYKEKEKND